MTARLGILQKFQAWMMALAGKPAEAPEPVQPGEQPLFKLSRMMVAIASPDGRRGGGIQLMVDALTRSKSPVNPANCSRKARDWNSPC